MVGNVVLPQGFKWAEQLRSRLPQLRLLCHCGGGSFKQQFKRADKSGARWALILGEDEYAQQKITVKYLRETAPQQSLTFPEVEDFLAKVLSH